MDPIHAPPPPSPSSSPHLPPPPLPPPPKAKGKRRKKRGRRGGGISGGKGGLGFHPAPPFPRPALSHLWAGPPNFGASIVFIARPAQKLKKTIGAT
jgi:hypothetical protein